MDDNSTMRGIMKRSVIMKMSVSVEVPVSKTVALVAVALNMPCLVHRTSGSYDQLFI